MVGRRLSGGIIGKRNQTSGGGNTITRFDGSGNFTLHKGTTQADVLVVAGGGAGGASHGSYEAGGGGAGGFRNMTAQQVLPGGTIAVTVGSGGGSSPAPGSVPVQGNSGSNSVFANPLSPITATGGGGGGGGEAYAPYPPSTNSLNDGKPGGSGGGASYAYNTNSTPGPGNAGGFDPVEGYAGGQSSLTNGGGGGGAGGAGQGGGQALGGPPGATQETANGDGGPGAISSITGKQVYYGGGGGGASLGIGTGVSPSHPLGGAGAIAFHGLGGIGGGGYGRHASGSGGHPSGGASGTGAVNLGGGGGGNVGVASPGGNTSGTGAAGGSGVVIVKELDKAQGVWDMKSQNLYHSQGKWPTSTIEDIGNSIMFARGDSAYLARDLDIPNARTFTVSCWFKFASANNMGLWSIGNATLGQPGDHADINFYLENNGRANVKAYDGIANAYRLRWGTDGSGVREFKIMDPAAWYHLCVQIDTTLASAQERDRVKVWINGVDVGNKFTHSNDPSQNTAIFPAAGYPDNAKPKLWIGQNQTQSTAYWDGYIADFYYIDGQALDASNFAENDPDCPTVWRPKKYYGTYGDQGCHLEFKQSGVGSGSTSTIGADTSGNLNHLDSTNVAATDQSIDTPTNNFCTMNPLDQGTITLSEGNTKIVCDGSNNDGCKGTIGFPSSGKWYFEYYMSAHDGGDAPQIMGIGQGGASNDTWVASGNYIVYEIDSGNKRIDQSSSSYGATATTGDTIGVAVNMDDNEVIFYKNGSTQGTISNAIITGDYYLPYIMDGSSVRSHETYANFGNPAFSISSGNADANGYGNFEHAVPSGHYALCTKNLAQYG